MSGGRRVGVLGGTFDPIHLGHLEAAEAARRALGLDEILIVPARISPHRPALPAVSAYHRFAMVALAIAHRQRYRACDLELDADALSYTAVTLARLADAGLRRSELWFVTGADAFAEISTWKDYPAILDRSHFAVVSRPGHSLEALHSRLPSAADRVRAIRAGDTIDIGAGVGDAPLGVFLVEAATPEISSTDIRRRLAAGRSIAGLVPGEVEEYIQRHRLYRSAGWPIPSLVS